MLTLDWLFKPVHRPHDDATQQSNTTDDTDDKTRTEHTETSTSNGTTANNDVHIPVQYS